jgi:hypothetical protein
MTWRGVLLRRGTGEWTAPMPFDIVSGVSNSTIDIKITAETLAVEAMFMHRAEVDSISIISAIFRHSASTAVPANASTTADTDSDGNSGHTPASAASPTAAAPPSSAANTE